MHGRPAAAGAAALLLALSAPSAALASTGGSDGRWYYDMTGMAEVHQQTTGEGITIGILDTPINPSAPDLVGADLWVHEPSYCAAEAGGAALPGVSTDTDARHGTTIASLLVGTDAGIGGEPGIPGVAPGAAVRAYPIIFGEACESPAGAGANLDPAMRDAVADGVDIIVVPGSNFITGEGIAAALKAGVIVIGAAGNWTSIVTGSPADKNGVVATGWVDQNVELSGGSPHGERLGVVAPGADFRSIASTWDEYTRTEGSSNSAAYTAGALALAWSLHPDATANQILQALVRTTDGQIKDVPAHDEDWGYGAVHVRTLVSVDPTTYPDENPFLSDDPTLEPRASDVLGAGPDDAVAPAPGPTTTPAAQPDATDEQEQDDGVPILAVVGGVAALVLVVGATTAVVVARRRRRPAHETAASTPHPQAPTYTGGNHG
jgi:hypothetical protein